MGIFEDIAYKRLVDYGFLVGTFPHGFDVSVEHEEIHPIDIEVIKSILWTSNCDYINIRKIEANTVRVTI